MLKAARILTGVVLVGLILFAASRAVRDCPAGPYIYDNCLWLWVRGALHLPQSKLLRAVTLEFVGLVLLAGLYATARFVFSLGRIKDAPGSGGPRDASTPPESKSCPGS
jgi:hypothetical protein